MTRSEIAETVAFGALLMIGLPALMAATYLVV